MRFNDKFYEDDFQDNKFPGTGSYINTASLPRAHVLIHVLILCLKAGIKEGKSAKHDAKVSCVPSLASCYTSYMVCHLICLKLATFP